LLTLRATLRGVTLQETDGGKYFENNEEKARQLKDDFLLPFDGLRRNTSANQPDYQGSAVWSWLSSPYSSTRGRIILMDSKTFKIVSHYRAFGFTIRCFKNP
jgi:hypothetical protein